MTVQFGTAIALAVLFPAWSLATPASAEPQSCIAAERARGEYMARTATPSRADFWLNYNMADVRASRTLREQQARDQLDQLSRLCLGELVSAQQYDSAISKAAHFGMLEEAERIARIQVLLARGREVK